jgi:hypothetical protein
VSVVDREEPVASCSEWHRDGAADENGRGSDLAATVPARAMGEAIQGDTSLVGKPRRRRGSCSDRFRVEIPGGSR